MTYTPGGGGAPTTLDYLVGTATGSLSAEIVAGTAPAGELGGTWASPTVDATHSGSAHHVHLVASGQASSTFPGGSEAFTTTTVSFGVTFASAPEVIISGRGTGATNSVCLHRAQNVTTTGFDYAGRHAQAVSPGAGTAVAAYWVAVGT